MLDTLRKAYNDDHISLGEHKAKYGTFMTLLSMLMGTLIWGRK